MREKEFMAEMKEGYLAHEQDVVEEYLQDLPPAERAEREQEECVLCTENDAASCGYCNDKPKESNAKYFDRMRQAEEISSAPTYEKAMENLAIIKVKYGNREPCSVCTVADGGLCPYCLDISSGRKRLRDRIESLIQIKPRVTDVSNLMEEMKKIPISENDIVAGEGDMLMQHALHSYQEQIETNLAIKIIGCGDFNKGVALIRSFAKGLLIARQKHTPEEWESFALEDAVKALQEESVEVQDALLFENEDRVLQEVADVVYVGIRTLLKEYKKD